MRTGRPEKPLEIGEEDRVKLRTIALRPKSAQAMAMRARIVLSCGQEMSNSEVARKLHITGATVGKWRERFRNFGLEGLLDELRVGAPRKITDHQIEEVVTKTLESKPKKQHTLEHSADGCRDGSVAERYRADLACVRIAATSGREFQILQRSAICGKGARYRGPVPESAGSRHCIVCG